MADRSNLVDDYVVADRDAPIPGEVAEVIEFASGEDLLDSKVGKLVQKGKVIEVMSDSPLLTAFHLIVQNKILSVPVYSVDKQKYIGFLDLVDIVYHFLEVLTDEEIQAGFEHFKDKFDKVKCQGLMNVSSRNPFKSLSMKASARAAIGLIDQWGVHRVPLIDASGECVSILSQSRLVQLFATNIGLFALAAKTVGEFQLGVREVYCAHKSDSAHVAFQKMRELGASALAIVNDAGALVDVLSVSDLRLLGQDMKQLERVTHTVEEFASHKTNKVAPLTVLLSDTIASVASKLLEFKVHRLYVVDAADKPIGVIVLGDFLRLFK